MSKRLAITLKSAGTTFLTYISATKSINTYNDYQLTINRFLTHVGDMPLVDVTADHAIDFIHQLKTTPYKTDPNGKPIYRKPKSIKNIHTALASFARWCADRKYHENFMDSIPSPKSPRTPIKPFNQKQIKALLNGCTESRPWKNRPLTRNHRPTAGRDRAIIAVLVETGIRATELCNLTIADVTFRKEGGEVHVRLGKGGKDRHVPFSRTCANILRDWLITRPDHTPHDPLFIAVIRNFGVPMNRSTVRRAINNIGKRVGIQGVTPHKMRTTALCMMAQNGMTAFNLKLIAGHSNIETTMRYVEAAHINLDDAMRHASPLDNIRT